MRQLREIRRLLHDWNSRRHEMAERRHKPAVSVRSPLTEIDRPPGRLFSAVDAATAAVVDPRHPIRQEVDQLDQKLDQHREESAKLDTLPLGWSNR